MIEQVVHPHNLQRALRTSNCQQRQEGIDKMRRTHGPLREHKQTIIKTIQEGNYRSSHPWRGDSKANGKTRLLRFPQ